MKTNIFTTLMLCLTFLTTHAQEKESSKALDQQFNVLFGMNQIMLNGFNVELNYFHHRLAFDYSHGVSLNLDNEYLDPTNKELGIDVHIPWTTGFGIGYRFNEWFNLRAEPKWHKFELYQMGQEQNSENLIDSYTTFTLGIGAYCNLKPFKKKNSFLRGIMVAPSIRYWPQVSSSLENDELQFYSEELDEIVTHKALQVGIQNTPLIVNISIGYSFDWKL